MLQPLPRLPAFQRVQVMQIITVVGISLVCLGFLWIVLTLPVSSTISNFETNGVLSSDAANTVYFIKIMVGAIPILIGLSCVGWGWIKSVEEREYGFPLPD